MKILAIEFSSAQRSVAVVQSGRDGGLGASEVIETGGRAIRGLGAIEEALRQAQIEREQIECVAVGLGPGSYTGIRAAIALAQGWQLAREVKLLGVSSVEGIVAQAQAEGLSGLVHVVIDAQRNELYWAAYEVERAERREVAPLRLATIAEVRAKSLSRFICGKRRSSKPLRREYCREDAERNHKAGKSRTRTRTRTRVSAACRNLGAIPANRALGLQIRTSLPRLLRLFLAMLTFVAGGQPPPTNDQDAGRQAAIAEFTRKMKEANYPALFEQAGREFNVPADILKAVSFAETRWDHLTWPPGETASPETGMPRPYGIMSLWDNKYFGQSLLEAAKLIGKEPEELKRDPLQNIRGAAALLRTLYDSTPRPDGSSEAEIESWRYSIRKYCGIPEPDLNARHALDVYTFMNQGYHEYGIEWEARPVNLGPIREETRRIIEEEEKKRAAGKGTNVVAQTPVLSQASPAITATNLRANAVVNPASELPAKEPKHKSRILLTCVLAIAVLIVGWVLGRRRRD